MPRRRAAETFPCPNCGADVPEDAKACPECGSDDETGWSEDTMYDDIDLPITDEESDYDPETDDRKSTVSIWMIMGAIVVIVAMLVLLTRL